MARIKPNPYIIADRAQCEGALAEMAALDRKLSTIENDMQEAVDAAKSKASQLAGPLQARRKELSDAVTGRETNGVQADQERTGDAGDAVRGGPSLPVLRDPGRFAGTGITHGLEERGKA